MFEEFNNTLGCQYFYKDLKMVDNDPKCDSLWRDIRKVYNTWNIYDLTKRITPALAKKRMLLE